MSLGLFETDPFANADRPAQKFFWRFSLYTASPTMLPRNLQSLAIKSAARRRAALSRQNAPFPPPFRISPSAGIAGFHSSSRRQDELPKSPFQTFVEVLRDELKKNRELQDNVKQLQGDVDKLQDSEAMKRAKAAYERARVCSITRRSCHLPTCFIRS